MNRLLHLWHWFTRDPRGKTVIAEKPNPPIIVALLSYALATILPLENLRSAFHWLATVSLLIWAALEIGWGHSPIRRAMGTITLVVIAAFIVW